jgi:hypothetical protein
MSSEAFSGVLNSTFPTYFMNQISFQNGVATYPGHTAFTVTREGLEEEGEEGILCESVEGGGDVGVMGSVLVEFMFVALE